MNQGYESTLKKKAVTYYNALGSFVNANTVQLEFGDGRKEIKTASYVVIAVGGRPTQLGCPGEEHAITSDDIFWKKESPGKTLCVGASYVALECAGFLTGIGLDTTVMIRSIPLRGYDIEVANRIVSYMETSHTKFIRSATVDKIEKLASGRFKVTYVENKIYTGPRADGHMRPAGNAGVIEVDTVLAAIGRKPDTAGLNLANAGVKTTKKGEIPTNDSDCTNVANIFCIGDCAVGRPELTPVAIQAGKMLAKRLVGKSKKLMDYDRVATTVFTPIEYSCVGFAEDKYRTLNGSPKPFSSDPKDTYQSFALQAGVRVYRAEFMPLEWYLTAERKHQPKCYMKVIVDERSGGILGIHYLGPNAGEVMQMASLAVRCGATFEELQETVGIHPTCAEVFTIIEHMDAVQSASATAKVALPAGSPVPEPEDEACAT